MRYSSKKKKNRYRSTANKKEKIYLKNYGMTVSCGSHYSGWTAEQLLLNLQVFSADTLHRQKKLFLKRIENSVINIWNAISFHFFFFDFLFKNGKNFFRGIWTVYVWSGLELNLQFFDNLKMKKCSNNKMREKNICNN